MFCGKEKEKKQRRFERKKNKTIIRCDIGWTRKKKSVRSSIKYHAMLACGGVEIGFHALLTSALGIGASQSGRLTAGERAAGIHSIAGCVDPRPGSTAVNKKESRYSEFDRNRTPVFQLIRSHCSEKGKKQKKVHRKKKEQITIYMYI